jgi:hypothetical protein
LSALVVLGLALAQEQAAVQALVPVEVVQVQAGELESVLVQEQELV